MKKIRWEESIGKVSTVTHYAGIIDGETGETFAERLKNQAQQAGVEFAYEKVERTELGGKIKEIITDKNHYRAAKVILANGTTPENWESPGKQNFMAKELA